MAVLGIGQASFGKHLQANVSAATANSLLAMPDAP
jgi:hypothetical protein